MKQLYSPAVQPFFVVFLADHSCASPFGTFLCNTEKERGEAGVREHTVSLWSYLNQVQLGVREHTVSLWSYLNQVQLGVREHTVSCGYPYVIIYTKNSYMYLSQN